MELELIEFDKTCIYLILGSPLLRVHLGPNGDLDYLVVTYLVCEFSLSASESAAYL